MRALLALVVLPTIASQPPVETDLLRRIQSGKWFEAPRLRRDADGVLEIWAELSHLGTEDGFVPLLGPDLRDALPNAGTLGLLTLWLQGGGDLLALTDAEFHLRALGIDTNDASLRQHLMHASRADGALGRAEQLDRLVIIDLLRRRACRAATAELTGLLAQDNLPTAVRDRAQAALAELEGRPIVVARRRLDAAKLPLPRQLDLAILVDHARLPNMTEAVVYSGKLLGLRWATNFAPIESEPGARSTLQRLCLRNAELAFGLVHRFGNVRLDHSCTAVTLQLDEHPPFALCYQAAGEFESDVWSQAKPVEGHQLFPATHLEISRDRLTGHMGLDPGQPSPALAAQLLRSNNAAIRVVVPPRSKLGELAKRAGLTMLSAELSVTFSDRTANLRVSIDTPDETAAETWRARAEQLRREGQTALADDAGKPFRDEPGLAAACRAVLATEVSVAGARVHAATTLPIPGAAGWEALVIVTSR